MGKKTKIRFFNETGKLENIINFLENIQKKVNYTNIQCIVEGRDIEVTLSGPQDLQLLAIERLKALADKWLV